MAQRVTNRKRVRKKNNGNAKGKATRKPKKG